MKSNLHVITLIITTCNIKIINQIKCNYRTRCNSAKLRYCIKNVSKGVPRNFFRGGAQHRSPNPRLKENLCENLNCAKRKNFWRFSLRNARKMHTLSQFYRKIGAKRRKFLRFDAKQVQKFVSGTDFTHKSREARKFLHFVV